MVAVEFFAEVMALLLLREHIRLRRDQSGDEREYENSGDSENCTTLARTVLGLRRSLHFVLTILEKIVIAIEPARRPWTREFPSGRLKCLYHPDFCAFCKENRWNQLPWWVEINTTPHRSPAKARTAMPCPYREEESHVDREKVDASKIYSQQRCGGNGFAAGGEEHEIAGCDCSAAELRF
jgi:hypothetical protein